jgi:uncharacterized protein YjbI with pentapeptide repeats
MTARPSAVAVTKGCFFDQHELINYEGKSWCKYHLPHPKKIEWLRSKWGDDYLTQFNNEIFSFIDKKDNASLIGVVFPGDIDFGAHAAKTGRFPGIVLAGSEFHGNTSFKGIVMSDRPGDLSIMGRAADFTSAVFHGTVDFRNSIFDAVYFIDTRFQNGSSFNYAQFGRDAYFDRAIFYNNVDFRNAHFFHGARFDNVEFQNRETYFESTIFDTWASFRDAIFFGEAKFSGSGTGDRLNEAFHYVYFSGVDFQGPADFNDRFFSKRTDFSNAIFRKAPNFFGSQLHQETKFLGAKFLDINSESAVETYRTLKIAMASSKARDEEGLFFALEQKSLRKRKGAELSVKILSILYETASNYGRSPTRPINMFLLMTSLFTVAYYMMGQSFGIVSWREALFLTTAQIFKPFEIMVGVPSYAENKWIACALIEHPIILRLMCGFQSLLGAVFSTLFLLALRWRFMRE